MQSQNVPPALTAQYLLAHTHARRDVALSFCHTTVLGKEKPSCRRGREDAKDGKGRGGRRQGRRPHRRKACLFFFQWRRRWRAPSPPLAASADATTAAAVVVVVSSFCQKPGDNNSLAVMVVVAACKCHPQAHLASPLQLLVEMEARAGQLWILMAFSR